MATPAGAGAGAFKSRPRSWLGRRRSIAAAGEPDRPSLGTDVLADAAARLPFTPLGRASYASDWTSGAFPGILAPAAHVCLLSLIPALAFGEQAALATSGAVSGASVLISTALFGVLQALIGGQPLLIVGVAEPLVLVYTYLATFVARVPNLPFLPFAAWSCAWAALFLAVAALAGAGRAVSRFTRFSSDLFGALVGGALFMQQAVALCIRQFRGGGEGDDSSEAARAWRLANGTWGLFLAIGLTTSVLAARRARGWSIGPPALRAAVADVAAPLGVLAWSGLAYVVRAPTGGGFTPPGALLPRSLSLPAPWEAGPASAWSVASRMGGLGGKWAGAACVPGLMIAALFYFDHTIVQRVALPEGNGGGGNAVAVEGDDVGPSGGRAAESGGPPPPHKRPTYALDLLFLALFTLAAGRLGLPPVNGVLPQAPKHTHALSVAAKEEAARVARRRKGATEAGAEEAPSLTPPPPPLETRVAALLQSLAIAAAIGATPLLSR